MSLLSFHVTSCRINQVSRLLIVQLTRQASLMPRLPRGPEFPTRAPPRPLNGPRMLPQHKGGSSAYRCFPESWTPFRSAGGPPFLVVVSSRIDTEPLAHTIQRACVFIAAVMPVLGQQRFSQDAEVEGKAIFIPVECRSVVQEATTCPSFRDSDTWTDTCMVHRWLARTYWYPRRERNNRVRLRDSEHWSGKVRRLRSQMVCVLMKAPPVHPWATYLTSLCLLTGVPNSNS